MYIYLIKVNNTIAFKQMVSTIFDILSALSDKGALSIFKIVSLGNTNVTSGLLMTKLKLTRKQYYSKMMALMKAGLIYRMEGKYFLTSLGKVAYHLIIKFEGFVNNYWKLKAIDSIQMSYSDYHYMSKEEYSKIVNDLIDDYEIRDILLSVKEEGQEHNNRQVKELPINSDK